ncbi:MAG: hypothetical protein STSR0009_29250 [Methanoregula sp.]
MGTFECVQGMIAGYLASPKGQQAIQNYLASPEGKATINSYLATPDGQKMARLLLSQAMDKLDISEDAKAVIRTALTQ